MVIQHTTPVLVVGAGPAGLIAALQLAKNGTECMLVERNLDTTKWPKMDVTNVRSMELFRRLGIADGLRDVGVPQHYSFNVNFSTGLSDGGQLITKWDLASPDEWRRRIHGQNDGSMPREPYQRCSQAIFEAWLKPRIQSEKLIKSMFGIKFDKLTETDTHVECELTDDAGEMHVVTAQYVVGCDGAGSRVRRSIGGTLIGGPVPVALYLVHFKSRDLTKIQRQGQFWHIFFTSGHVIIAQDEKDTWTCHTPVPLDTDVSAISPEEAVYKVLGGSLKPVPIKIDEILVTSSWRPNICIVDEYSSPQRRVFLAGDAAHQNIPTGGYGMNSAVGDSFDIGWKLAAVLAGYGGRHLLDSYHVERKPVAERNLERSGVFWSVHADIWGWVGASGETVTLQTEQGEALRAKIIEYAQKHDGENKDQGLELGYRYNGSPVIYNEEEPTSEPIWKEREYVPSTWPGARAPHVFLKDGKTSIFDLFGTGRQYSLVDFTQEGHFATQFERVARSLGVPLKMIHLAEESHVRTIWERCAVLVRPDDHVAWRASNDNHMDALDVEHVLIVATGKHGNQGRPESNRPVESTKAGGFTGTVGNVDQDQVAMLADFQK